jgi:hypothetical protein
VCVQAALHAAATATVVDGELFAEDGQPRTRNGTRVPDDVRHRQIYCYYQLPMVINY